MTYNSNHIEGSKLSKEQTRLIFETNTINIGGEIVTTKPSEVSKHMKTLLERYNAKENIKIEDIIKFHAEFENIHPFQDGNERVGRLIILKECLKNNIIPFIIKDNKKVFIIEDFLNGNMKKDG